MSSISRDIRTEPHSAAFRPRSPTVSVVATVTSGIVSGAWILELAKRCGRIDAELIVVTPAVPRLDAFAVDHQKIRIVYGENASTQYELRARGVEAAQGDIVLFVQELELIDAAAVEIRVRAGLGRGGVPLHQVLEAQRAVPAAPSISSDTTLPSLGGPLYQERGVETSESTV